MKPVKELVHLAVQARIPPPSVLPLRPSVKAVLQVCIARKPVLVRAKVVAPARMAQKLARPLLLVVKNVWLDNTRTTRPVLHANVAKLVIS